MKPKLSLIHISFDGIQAYAGQLSHKDLSIRQPGVEKTEQTMRELKAYVQERGIEVREISGGSTGTVEMKAAHGVYTEIQAGSCLLYTSKSVRCCRRR